jgi:hypothetical protein
LLSGDVPGDTPSLPSLRYTGLKNRPAHFGHLLECKHLSGNLSNPGIRRRFDVL